MSVDARVREVLDSLGRDDRLGAVWRPLTAPLWEALTAEDDEGLVEAVDEVARSAAISRSPRLHTVLEALDEGFRRLLERVEGGTGEERLNALVRPTFSMASCSYADAMEEWARELEQRMAEASAVDPHTGVLRPQALLNHVALEIVRCQRMELPLGVAAVSVEPSADGRVAESNAGPLLRENVRRYDGVGCLDTGEYVAVLPDVSRAGLASAAERLHGVLTSDPRSEQASCRFALAHLDEVDAAPEELFDQLHAKLGVPGEDYLCWV